MSWQESYVTSVEVLISMSDGSAHSLTTTDCIIDEASIGMERAHPPNYGWPISVAPTPIIELTVTINGPSLRFVQQHHPAPKEGP